MKGLVEIQKMNRDGEVVDERKITNLVVSGAYVNLARLLAGPEHNLNREITQMQFGTGSMSPAITDTRLQLPITPVKTIQSVDIFYAEFSVSFRAFLLAEEGNGFSISEAGLITDSRVLIARCGFSGLEKTSDYILGFTWTIVTGEFDY